ncbi:hypothetical protein EDC04DRAFT_1077284 [Pisolithus marmoratus]|nr:hypothetical protein EDC04DRAFT_1077284 [Pisolithus marmoratus]
MRMVRKAHGSVSSPSVFTIASGPCRTSRLNWTICCGTNIRTHPRSPFALKLIKSKSTLTSVGATEVVVLERMTSIPGEQSISLFIRIIVIYVCIGTLHDTPRQNTAYRIKLCAQADSRYSRPKGEFEVLHILPSSDSSSSKTFGKKMGKVVPVRIRNPWGKGKSTRKLRDHSIAAGLYNVSARILASNSFHVSPAPDRQPSTVVSASKTSHILSPHNVSDAIQITLPMVQAIAEGIPVAGAPLKAVIGGLLSVLQIIDKHVQNREDLDDLTRLLYDLSCHIANAPTAQSCSEEARRQALIKVLEDTTIKLNRMHSCISGSTRLTNEIAACFRNINGHLLLYKVSSEMQIQNDLHHLTMHVETLSTRFQSVMQFLDAGHLPTAMTAGCVIVVDATGLEHNMLVDQCNSLDLLNAFLPGILKQCQPDKAQIQQWYIDRGQYDFVIDNGTNVAQLTRESDIWPTIQPGTKIVMRVIITEVSRKKSATHQCRCGAWNNYEVERALAQCCIITCYHCQRRYQITLTEEGEATSRQGERSQFGDDGLVRGEKSLIRNFLMKEVVCGTRVYSCIHDFTDISNLGKYSCFRRRRHSPSVIQECPVCGKTVREVYVANYWTGVVGTIWPLLTTLSIYRLTRESNVVLVV